MSVFNVMRRRRGNKLRSKPSEEKLLFLAFSEFNFPKLVIYVYPVV